MSIDNTPKILDGQSILFVQKNRGETLASLLKRVRSEKAIASDIPMTYAGRLDPMAEGAMVILAGDACKDKERYMNLDKTYHFEVLLGIGTDTYDMLGLVHDSNLPTNLSLHAVQDVCAKISQKTEFEYPPYSSRLVEGEPLFVHARAGNIPVVLPKKRGCIHTLICSEIKTVALGTLITESINTINRVEGDFRQEAIIAGWKTILAQYPDIQVQLAVCEATVSSGIYIRSIAQDIGKLCSIPALAYTINRTEIHY